MDATPTRQPSIIAEAERLLGGGAVSRPDPDRTNVSRFRPRAVAAVLRPGSVDEVRRIVPLFDDEDAPSLQAFSTGRNWGLGSREPAENGSVSLDLSRLRSVRDLDLDRGWAVVEPGVTQADLAARTAGTERMLNVTASSAETSVVGNALDRGVGLRHQRVEDLAGLEVVLPDGELVRLGWWPDPPRDTPVYRHGTGPDLMPAFVQSNLGVVTAAVVRLPPRPEAQRVLRFAFAATEVADAVDHLRRWRAQGTVGGVIKVYDATSSASYGAGAGGYHAFLSVEGTARSVDAGVRVLEAEAAEAGVFTAVEDLPGDVVGAMVRSAYAGDPGHNDAMLRATLGVDGAEGVDGAGVGWLFFLPLVPFEGAAVARALRMLADIGAETGVVPGATVNALDADVVDLVVSLKFDPADADKAHHTLDRLHEEFVSVGYLPYRADVGHGRWNGHRGPDRSALELVRRLKRVLDPRGAIAPGRYA